MYRALIVRAAARESQQPCTCFLLRQTLNPRRVALTSKTWGLQEVLDVGVVSNLVVGYSASGQFFWALHYWLAQRQRELATPSLNAHQALLCACRDRAAWQPALHVLYAMLASTVSSLSASDTTPFSQLRPGPESGCACEMLAVMPRLQL